MFSFHRRNTELPDGTSGKEPTCQYMRQKRHEFDSWVGKIPWRRAWQPTPVFVPGGSPGQMSLAGYSPQGCRVTHDWNGLACTHGNTKRSCDSHSGAWKEQIHMLRPGMGAREKEPGPLMMPLSYCTCAGLPTPSLLKSSLDVLIALLFSH